MPPAVPALATAAPPGIQAVTEVTVFEAIVCTRVGVTAVHGSLLLPAGAVSSPLTRWTPLPDASVTSQM
jgi:hypothetical protein